MFRKRNIVDAAAAAAAAAVCIGFGSQAKAENVPLINPGFDSFVTGTGGAFHYEGNAYTADDFIPNHTFLTGMPANDLDAFIADSHSGAQILNDGHNAEATGSVHGYVGSPTSSAGTLYDDRDWNPGQGPDRAAGFISLSSTTPSASIKQANSGNLYQPNTHYTFTIQVSDRFAIQPNDVVSFPSSVSAALMDGANEITTGTTTTFTPPTNGNTTVLRLDFTTGVTAPTGQIGFVLHASGVAGPNPQAFFDNAALNAVSVAQMYWDTNGTSPGAGGLAPSGNWDGTTSNFNSDSTGGAGGEFLATTNTGQTVIFAADTTATGSYSVTLTGTRAAASVVVQEGNVTLSGGTLATGAFDVAAGATGVVNSTVSGGVVAGVVKQGSGILTLGAANTYTGGTTVSGGTLIAANADAFGGSTAGGLSVANGALARAQAGLSKAVTLASVATTGSGQVDITDNSMVLRNTTVAAVQAEIAKAYNSGHWNGNGGLNSSTASTSTETSVGYASNASLNLTSFKGVTGLTASDVLVKYTYAGDANLDGKVDIGDLGLLAGAWQQSGKVWFDGDFTYNGTVDIGDLGLLAGNWQKGVSSGQLLVSLDEAMAQFAAFDGVVVPEPTGIGLLGLAGIGALARRRRRRRERRRVFASDASCVCH